MAFFTWAVCTSCSPQSLKIKLESFLLLLFFPPSAMLNFELCFELCP